ncbi:DUF1128 domain-containing protein [Massilibacterium senegalense]|uniref:DUF1128 domain-containing protein n=1 Tax=Massilibacterium senegalense TaxID=1632858 RepID=UPI0007844436|nr:DUF1128 domain-containing protein [Massilibacterium senegalense]
MDFSVKSKENIKKMIACIQDKLQMVNRAVLQPEDIDMKYYDELLEVYEMIAKKDSFSVSEINAIIDELRTFRKA